MSRGSIEVKAAMDDHAGQGWRLRFKAWQERDGRRRSLLVLSCQASSCYTLFVLQRDQVCSDRGHESSLKDRWYLSRISLLVSNGSLSTRKSLSRERGKAVLQNAW